MSNNLNLDPALEPLFPVLPKSNVNAAGESGQSKERMYRIDDTKKQPDTKTIESMEKFIKTLLRSPGNTGKKTDHALLFDSDVKIIGDGINICFHCISCKKSVVVGKKRWFRSVPTKKVNFFIHIIVDKSNNMIKILVDPSEEKANDCSGFNFYPKASYTLRPNPKMRIIVSIEEGLFKQIKRTLGGQISKRFEYDERARTHNIRTLNSVTIEGAESFSL